MTFEPTIAGTPVTLRASPRARRMQLKVDPRTRKIVLTVPRRVSERRALAWAETQREWIERTLAAIPEFTPLRPGDAVPVEGVPHLIDWALDRPRRIAIANGRILAGGPVDLVEARLLRFLKARALERLTAETHEFAAHAGRTVTKVGVGDPVSRWGSCTGAGAIRYSWRLILAPVFVRRATVAHEVAHLVHMHHGPDFHGLVAEILGEDPRPARDWLRREGAGLHRLGRSG